MANREYPERPLVGVGGVVISGDCVLLVRRGAPPLLGQWSIPGGLLESGETIFEGVRRELLEETRVDVRVLELIEVFERISLDAAGKAQYHYVVLDYLCQSIAGDARAGSDASEVALVAERDLEHYSLSSAAQRVILKAFAMSKDRADKSA